MSGYYGYFAGGDPRKFHPDVEMCSESELKAHAEACVAAEAAEEKRKLECPSSLILDEKGWALIHINHAPFGIGFNED